MEPDFDLLPRPTLVRNLGFWLAAMLLGTMLLLVLTALIWDKPADLDTPLRVVLLSTLLSLAALPLLLPTLPWALTAGSVPERWGRLVLLQGLALLLLVLLGYGLWGGDKFASIGWLVGPIFSLGGLLAARLVYAAWL